MANTLTFASQTLTDANIFGGINYLADLNTGTEFSIGNTASASVRFVTDTQLPLYSKDAANGTFTWTRDNVSRGRYYITEATKNNGQYEITAYDAMYLLDTNISALSLSLPMTAEDIADEIADYCGCTVSGTINNGSLSVSALDADMTIRQLLGYVAEASGCSVKIDGSDHLCFMYYADSGITVTASAYKTLNVADYTCAAIDYVCIINSAGEIQATAGSGANALYIGQNPFLEEATATEAAVILDQVDGFVYAPLTCEMFTENGLEVGTIATFGSTQSLVMHLESSESGATASSVGTDSRGEYNKSVLVLVNEAKTVAVDAQAAAADALNAANIANVSANSALESAATAQAAADSATEDAATANANALAATNYANSALGQLSEVEKVVDVLTWAAEHGTYELTTDTEVVEGKYYFTRSGSGTASDPYKYAVVTDPASDPSDAGYYELSGVDEAMSNYIATHLALTDDGLFVQIDDNACKLQITSTGIMLYDETGTVIASYGDSIVLGDVTGQHIEQTSGELGFYQGSTKVAYISGAQLYITQAEVTQSMRIGDFIWNVETGRINLRYSPLS